MSKKYKIFVLSIQGKPLTFTISSHKIVEGNFVEFFDERTGEKKKFHSSRCEFGELGVDD